MAPRHRRAYTQTHIMLISPPLWLLLQNTGGISYRRTLTNPDNISLVTTPPPSFPQLSSSHAEDVSVANGQSTFVAGALAFLYTGEKEQSIKSSAVTGLRMGGCEVRKWLYGCTSVSLSSFSANCTLDEETLAAFHDISISILVCGFVILTTESCMFLVMLYI